MATVDKTGPGTSARHDANGHKGVASFTDSLEMGVGIGGVATPFLSAGISLSVHDRDVGQHGLRRAPGQVRGCCGPRVGEAGRWTSRQEPCLPHRPLTPCPASPSSSLQEGAGSQFTGNWRLCYSPSGSNPTGSALAKCLPLGQSHTEDALCNSVWHNPSEGQGPDRLVPVPAPQPRVRPRNSGSLCLWLWR